MEINTGDIGVNPCSSQTTNREPWSSFGAINRHGMGRVPFFSHELFEGGVLLNERPKEKAMGTQPEAADDTNI